MKGQGTGIDRLQRLPGLAPDCGLAQPAVLRALHLGDVRKMRRKA